MMVPAAVPNGPPPTAPEDLRKRFNALAWQARSLETELVKTRKALAEIDAFLELEPKISERLEWLSTNLFGDILDEVERNLSYALQEVLGQNLKVVTLREVKGRKVNITFSMERDGKPEDILRGQGGSVCNILSVGLRLIALSQTDAQEHRRFLILDEQDCWLRPDLVPRLMAIIHAIAHKLQFQILVISHHNVELFKEHADRIYRIFAPAAADQGARVELLYRREDRDLS
jgi:DNA repair exonuclease SbcCD ATPase subunit